jgi:hypothetical protein
MRLPGCTGTATTAQHTDDGRLVPACAHCNFADGARRRADAYSRKAFSPTRKDRMAALLTRPQKSPILGTSR